MGKVNENECFFTDSVGFLRKHENNILKIIGFSAILNKISNTESDTVSVFTKYLLCFLISMVPIVELRGAIPVGVAWGLDVFWLYPICIIGNMLPVPFIFFFARKVLLWGKDKKYIGKFFTFCLNKGEKGGQKLQAKAGRGLFIALMLFVGIPLPGTGAWTGTLAASFLDMDFKKSVIAVICGVLIAGVIMGAASIAVKMGMGGIFAFMANAK